MIKIIKQLIKNNKLLIRNTLPNTLHFYFLR